MKPRVVDVTSFHLRLEALDCLPDSPGRKRLTAKAEKFQLYHWWLFHFAPTQIEKPSEGTNPTAPATNPFKLLLGSNPLTQGHRHQRHSSTSSLISIVKMVCPHRFR